MVFYLLQASNLAGTKYNNYCKYAIIIYKPWVLDTNTICGGADSIYNVIHGAWGKFVIDTRAAGNIVSDILRHDMDYYAQHRNKLINFDHADDFDAPLNSGYGAGEDEVIKCDINSNLWIASEANCGVLVLG